MQFSVEAELDVISKAAQAMALAWEGKNKALFHAAIGALKNRPQSPLANAVGVAIEGVVKQPAFDGALK